MLTLYYWPGASSVIPHIALEEIVAPYERKLINLAKGEHKSDAYLKINPRGKVPAFSVDGNVHTENVAILTYLAKQFPDARLLPQLKPIWTELPSTMLKGDAVGRMRLSAKPAFA